MKIGSHIVCAVVLVLAVLLPEPAGHVAASAEAVPRAVAPIAYWAEAPAEWAALPTLAFHSGTQTPAPKILAGLPSPKFLNGSAVATTSPDGQRNGMEPLALMALGALLIGVSAQGRRWLNLLNGHFGHENEPLASLWRKTLQH